MNNKLIIDIKNLHKSFPGVHALNDVQLEIYEGEVHALMGENGAGKSTLIKVIAGVHNFDEGKFFFEGKSANFTSPIDAISSGISVIYQELNLVESLSIVENIFFGNLPRTGSGRVLWKKAMEDATNILKEVGLDISPKEKVERLSTAQKQLVEIGKAVSKKSKVIIMDEPTSALSPKEIKFLFNLINDLKNRGIAVIFVSHKLDEVFAITDKVSMYRDGKYVSTEKTCDLTEEMIISSMVGREIKDMYPKTENKIGSAVLEVENFSTNKVTDISFKVMAGEVVGFSGLMGSGRSELVKGIFGIDKKITGTIKIDGNIVKKSDTAISKKMGVGFVSEDRKKEGIFNNLSVSKNMLVSSLRQFKKVLFQDVTSESKSVDMEIDKLKIKTPSKEQLIVNLSGGNQQKVLISRWLINKDLKLLIIDEPTRGIDIGAKSEIYSIINELSKQGLGIIVVSSEMPEILGICDRIYVMQGGTIRNEFTREEATQEKLMKSAIV